MLKVRDRHREPTIAYEAIVAHRYEIVISAPDRATQRFYLDREELEQLIEEASEALWPENKDGIQNRGET